MAFAIKPKQTVVFIGDSITDSRALRTPCTQILSDELAHVRFQSRRLAILRRRYGRPAS